MELQYPSKPLPLRRRASLCSRARRQIKRMLNESKDGPVLDVGTACCLLDEEHKATGMFARAPNPLEHNTMLYGEKGQTSSTRKPRASFSGFSHAVTDLRAFPKRMASQRRKSLALEGLGRYQEHTHGVHEIHSRRWFSTKSPMRTDEHCHHSPPKTTGWVRRCVSTTFRNRRQGLENTSRPTTSNWAGHDASHVPITLPGTTQPLLPESRLGGAAARAAAAEQNQMLEYWRHIRIKERHVRGDSESGVGIDTRSAEVDSAVKRRGRPPRVHCQVTATKVCHRSRQ